MEITRLPIGQLHAGANPRTEFDDEALHELAASIARDGVLEPIRVVANEEGYRIESGERRYRAALIAGLAEVDCIVAEGDATDEYVRAVVTNLQRQDLNPVDEARAYKVLMDEHGLTVDGIVERLGVPKARVTMRLALLELPVAIVQLYFDQRLRLDCRPVLLEIAKVSEDLAVHVANTVADKEDWGATLAKEPLRVVRYAVAQHAKENAGKRPAWILIPDRVDRVHLGLNATQKEAAKGFDREWAGWKPEYTEQDLDAAIAAGVAYTGQDGDGPRFGVVVDQAWMTSQFDVVYKRRVDREKQMQEEDIKREAAAKANRIATGAAGAASSEKSDAEAAYRKAENQARRDAKVAARAANLELGRKLYGELPAVTKGLDKDVATVLVGLMLANRQTDLFLCGLRYCLEQFQTVDEKGKVTYVQAVKDAAKHVTTFLGGVDGDEMVRRTLVILGCSRYADDGAVAQSDRRGRLAEAQSTMGSHDIETIQYVKALERHIREYVPAASRGKDKPSVKLMAKFNRAWVDSQAAKESA